ncbi:MAG: NADH-quinone oxidoreductase subunit NuoH [Acidimicrobiia bacterium]|nr:NADH-quinone oxidoreductase subunit NuoH [Acidimicrobiia bacterium]MDH4308059.1 NADH-quinone oxidoreductase subunit NuoH [Acidimicrobiia bacterium]MDH5295121.1 NADH-quinone oxidoreductase subunit NuoH [Acidimicrobiia bacterium]
MDLTDFLLVLLRVVATFVLLLLVTVLNVWAERKIVADMQNRIGPDRAGPWGILQTVADGLKLFFKEQVNPRKAEMGMFVLAPFLAVIPAFLLFMMVPWGRPIEFADGSTFPLQGADLNIGLLFVLAMSSMAVYAVVLAGWSSGSKYPLLGGVRATAQAISYEAALGLAMVAVVVWMAASGEDGVMTLSLSEIVARQQGTYLGFLPRWNIFPQFGAFLVFFIAAVAETNRAPFDLVEAEQELVGGFHTEYSGMRFAMFFLAEYVNIFSMAALGATLFLGGWNGQIDTLFGWSTPGWLAAILPTVYFLFKTYVIVFMFFWIRATLPRLRYDQLMNLGWKRLIPGAIGWLALTAVVAAFWRFDAPWA